MGLSGSSAPHVRTMGEGVTTQQLGTSTCISHEYPYVAVHFSDFPPTSGAKTIWDACTSIFSGLDMMRGTIYLLPQCGSLATV